MFCFFSAAVLAFFALRSKPDSVPAVIHYMESTLTSGTSITDALESLFPLNLNTATAEELDLLPGIGPALAGQILAFRAESGGFSTVEDLLLVSGIGKAKLAGLSHLVFVEGGEGTRTTPAAVPRVDTLPAVPQTSAEPSANALPVTFPPPDTLPPLVTPAEKPITIIPPATSAPSIRYPLDLNTATREELETLPGIGPALAERIIAFRLAHDGFANVEELLLVSGIGEAKLAAIASLVTAVDGPWREPLVTTKPSKPETTPKEDKPPPSPVELNRATRQELLTLPSMTEKDADAILDLRELIQYFSSIEELNYVISPSLFGKIKAYVYVA